MIVEVTITFNIAHDCELKKKAKTVSTALKEMWSKMHNMCPKKMSPVQQKSVVFKLDTFSKIGHTSKNLHFQPRLTKDINSTRDATLVTVKMKIKVASHEIQR